MSRVWPTSHILLACSILVAAMFALALAYPFVFRMPGLPAYLEAFGQGDGRHPVFYPALELMKLAVAGLLGLVVTRVHRAYYNGEPPSRSLQQAQVLLCISGAMMMIIIGDSLARAFGIAGAASIVRFRTLVDDPKDAIILFLLLGLGMACGLAAFGVAVLAALFLCFMLVVLDHMSDTVTPRRLLVQLTAHGPEFPVQSVQDVFRRNGIQFEERAVMPGPEALMRYEVSVEPSTSLDAVSEQMRNGAGVKSVTWDQAKKKGS